MTTENVKDSKKGEMSATETMKSLEEYVSVPIVELIESRTNPQFLFHGGVMDVRITTCHLRPEMAQIALDEWEVWDAPRFPQKDPR
jgi:hypothetical protein